MDEDAIEDAPQSTRNIDPPATGKLEKKGKLRPGRPLISGENEGCMPFDPLDKRRIGRKGEGRSLTADKKRRSNTDCRRESFFHEKSSFVPE